MVVLQDTGRMTLGVSIAMTILAVVVITLRFVAQWKGKVEFRLEDGLIILGFGTFVAYVGCALKCLFSAGGTLDASQLELPELETVFFWIYIVEVLFTTTISLVKFSILAFYRTTFKPSKEFQRASVVVSAFCAIWFLVCFFVSIFQCSPPWAAWDLALFASGQAQCIAYGKFIIGYEITNILLDVAILALPIRAVWTLQMSKARKTILGGIFALGGFVCIIGVFRIVYLGDENLSAHPTGISSGLNWSTVELGIAITCACLPCCGHLFSIEKMSHGLARLCSTQQARTGWMGNRRYQRFESSTNNAQNTTGSTTEEQAQSKNQYPLNKIRVQHDIHLN